MRSGIRSQWRLWVIVYMSTAFRPTWMNTNTQQQPVLDCGIIFHPDCGGRDFRFFQIIFVNTSLWRLKCLVTLSTYRRYINKCIYLSIYCMASPLILLLFSKCRMWLFFVLLWQKTYSISCVFCIYMWHLLIVYFPFTWFSFAVVCVEAKRSDWFAGRICDGSEQFWIPWW